MESVYFHLKYWLKLTDPFVASTCMLAQRTLSRERRALPNDVLSKVECGQLHSKLFGRRRSTLQSHGLFALAKLLLRYGVHKVFGTHRFTHSVTHGRTDPNAVCLQHRFFNSGGKYSPRIVILCSELLCKIHDKCFRLNTTAWLTQRDRATAVCCAYV